MSVLIIEEEWEASLDNVLSHVQLFFFFLDFKFYLMTWNHPRALYSSRLKRRVDGLKSAEFVMFP